MRRRLFATTAAAVLLTGGALHAQQTEQQVAEQCMQDLQAFNEEMVTTGYGMAGPAGYGVGAGPPAGGWYGTMGPRREMSALFVAAQVFARQGNEEACQMVLREMRSLYEQRLAQIAEAGVAPEEVTGWRQQRLVEARPVGEMQRAISLDNVIGADVRNLQDEDLGDIEDVVLDDQGNIAYVLVEHGGFFGLGGDLVPVRWQDLRAAPDMDTFVLDVPESALEQAPTIDRDTFADLESYGQQREQVDQYWDQHTG